MQLKKNLNKQATISSFNPSPSWPSAASDNQFQFFFIFFLLNANEGHVVVTRCNSLLQIIITHGFRLKCMFRMYFLYVVLLDVFDIIEITYFWSAKKTRIKTFPLLTLLNSVSCSQMLMPYGRFSCRFLTQP